MSTAVNKPVLLTIVMPVYNGAQYTEKVLQNIAAQSFREYELVLLDALSTDDTTDIVKAKQAADKRIRLIVEKDEGIYDAMNRGIALAKGEWIYFMGCDDLFDDRETLTEMAAHLTLANDIVYADVLWVPDEIPEQGICTPRDLLNRNINHQRIFYRKELFQQYGGYDLQYKVAADHELNIRFFCNEDIKKKYVPVTVARYHSGGFSANKLDEVFWNNWKNIFRKNFLQHLPEREMYNKLGWYCRYQVDKRQYGKAFVLFLDVFVHTFSPGFVLLTFKQLIQSFRKHAG